jgi:hypothetical protein
MVYFNQRLKQLVNKEWYQFTSAKGQAYRHDFVSVPERSALWKCNALLQLTNGVSRGMQNAGATIYHCASHGALDKVLYTKCWWKIPAPIRELTRFWSLR